MAQLVNPEEKRPIVIIGAGSIVNIAHLPAYELAGFEVAGIFDLDKDKAEPCPGKKLRLRHGHTGSCIHFNLEAIAE
jgi:hypothetical protein